MTVYYAVCSSTGDPRIAGIHLTAESAQHAVQASKDKTVKCQPFTSIKEAKDYIASQVTIPAIGDSLVTPGAGVSPAATNATDPSKKRKLLASTSKAHNGKNDQKWEDKYLKLKQFTEDVADGNANLATESIYQRQDLSVWIQRQREIFRAWKQGHYENSTKAVDYKGRFIKLLELGVKLDSPPLSQWQTMANRWKSYHFPKGTNAYASSTIRPLAEDDDNPQMRELYQWQLAQQEEFENIVKKGVERRHLYPHRYLLLLEWNFPFPKCNKRQERSLLHGNGHKSLRKSFEQRLEEFLEYKDENGTPFVPTNEPGGLGEWCKKQRQRYKMKIQGRTPGDAMPISDENIQKLRDAGFPFEPVERGRRKSVTRVNLDDYDDNRNDELKPPKRSIRSFDERLQDFIEWKKENGTALVPQSLKGLGDWVHTQRRQYAKKLKGEVSSMSDGRISKLLAAGFIFDGNEARKQYALVKQERPLGDAPQLPSLNLETTMVAQQVVALGHSDPNPLGWY